MGNEKKISLRPLKFDEAIKDILKVKPPKNESKPKPKAKNEKPKPA